MYYKLCDYFSVLPVLKFRSALYIKEQQATISGTDKEENHACIILFI
jgi:hypothetical protein